MKRTERPVVIGVTGIMGSGKSTVARVFEEMGAARIDADAMGKQMLEEPEIAAEVVKAFGESVRGAGGAIDTGKLGRAAFATETGAHMLDRLTRKALIERIRTKIGELKSCAPVIVVDAALLAEWDAKPWLDVLVVVDSDEGRALERISSGGRFSEAAARLRMEHQFSRAEKARAADVLIVNDGSVEELREKARKVFLALVVSGGDGAVIGRE